MAYVISIEQRMEFINQVLTQEDADEKISHFERLKLMEEYDELAAKALHLRKRLNGNVISL